MARGLFADDVAFTVEKIQDPALKSPRQDDWADVSVNEVSPLESTNIHPKTALQLISGQCHGRHPAKAHMELGERRSIHLQPV